MCGRSDSEIYKTGVSECLNFKPSVLGPLRVRNGSEYIEIDIDPRNEVANLLTLKRAIGFDYVVEIGNNFVVVRGADGEQLLDSDVDSVIVDPEFYQKDTYWQFDPFGYRDGPLGRPAIAPGEVSWAKPGSAILPWEIQGIIQQVPEPSEPKFLGGTISQQVYIAPADFNAGNEYKLTFRYGCPITDAQIAGFSNYDDVEVLVKIWNSNKSAVDFQFTTILGQGYSNFEATFIPVFSTFWVEIGVSTEPNLNFDSFLKSTLEVQEVLLSEQFQQGQAVEFNSPWDTNEVQNVQWDMDTGVGELWITHPSVETRRLKRTDQGDWSFDAISAIAGYQDPAGNPWQPGSYPRAVAIHDGRLYLAGSENDPYTIYASRVDDYVDFNNQGADSADDPLNFPLRVGGRIMWMVSKQQLVIGTDQAEIVGYGTQGPLAFDDFQFDRQTDWGSAPIKPIKPGGEILYITPTFRKIRTFKQSGERQLLWDGDELTIYNNEIFDSNIVDIHWADDPEYQIVCLLANGKMVCGTYYYPESIIGWYRVETSGRIESITPVRTFQGTEIWAIVERENARKYEVFTFNLTSKIGLDSYLVREADSSGLVVGLDTFEGQFVDVIVQNIVDGVPYWTVKNGPTVILAGQLDLGPGSANAEVYVGYNYAKRVVTLEPEETNDKGTSLVTTQSFFTHFLKLNDSIVPKVNGSFPSDRSPSTPMGVGGKEVTIVANYPNVGYEERGVMTIEQDLPLITEILSAGGRLTSDDI